MKRGATDVRLFCKLEREVKLLHVRESVRESSAVCTKVDEEKSFLSERGGKNGGKNGARSRNSPLLFYTYLHFFYCYKAKF